MPDTLKNKKPDQQGSPLFWQETLSRTPSGKFEAQKTMLGGLDKWLLDGYRQHKQTFRTRPNCRHARARRCDTHDWILELVAKSLGEWFTYQTDIP